MKTKIIQLLFFALCANFSAFSQSKAQIVIDSVKEQDETLVINYSIVNANMGDVFNVTPYAKLSSNGAKLKMNSLSGDFGSMIKGGYNKQMVWDFKQDKIYLNEYVKIQLKAKIGRDMTNFSLGKLIFSSILFPGSGLKTLTNKGAYITLGILGYAAVASSVDLAFKAKSSFTAYESAVEVGERSSLFEQSKSQNKIAGVLGVSAIGVWAFDFILLKSTWKKMKRQNASIHENWMNNISFSPTYNPRLNQAQFTLNYKF